MQQAFGYWHQHNGPEGSIGLDKDPQQESILDYFSRVLKPHSIPWGGFFGDVGESRNFWDREAGAALYDRLDRGDNLIVAKADRAFHCEGDLVKMIGVFDRRSVTVHFPKIEQQGDLFVVASVDTSGCRLRFRCIHIE